MSIKITLTSLPKLCTISVDALNKTWPNNIEGIIFTSRAFLITTLSAGFLIMAL
jgi:hypothetical protein